MSLRTALAAKESSATGQLVEIEPVGNKHEVTGLTDMSDGMSP